MTNSIKLKINNSPTPTIEIDMWEIEGKHAEGKWHILIHRYIKSWLASTKFKKTATFWSTVAGSVNFNHYGNSCFIAVFGLPDHFLYDLQEHLAIEIPNQIRFSDEFFVKRSDGWRPYLHIEQGTPCKPWENEG